MAKTRRNRLGRKRKNQPRHKSGQLIREKPDEVAIQSRMRHKRISRTVAKTQEAGHVMDKFRRSGEISQKQFEAADHWNKAVNDNAWAILTTRMRSGSDYSGGGGHDNSDGTEPAYIDQCQRARQKYAELRHAVLCSDSQGMMVMQMACEDKPFSYDFLGTYRMAANAIMRIVER